MFNYDLSTDVGKCRLLTTDTNFQAYTFEDEELQALLDMLDGNVWNAAATACETKARAQLTLSTETKIGSYVTKRRTPAEWMALAESIRQASLKGTLQTGTIDVSYPDDNLDSFRPDWRGVLDIPIVE